MPFIMYLRMEDTEIAEGATGVMAHHSIFRGRRYTMEAEAVVALTGVLSEVQEGRGEEVMDRL